MSKSTVKPETGPQYSVKDAILKGQQINKLRVETSKDSIKPIYAKKPSTKKKNKKSAPVIICKVVWPEEIGRYEKCQHDKDIVIDRDLLNKQNHINLLATPRKSPVQNQGPIVVQRHLLPATVRINELAQPNKNLLLQNFKDHHHHLKIFQIENFLKHFYNLHYQTPKQAVSRRRQEIRDEKMRQKYLNKEIKHLKDKIYQEKLKAAEKLVATVLEKLKVELLNEKEVQLTDEMEEKSGIILRSICNLMGQKLPKRESTNTVDKFFCNLADRLALYLEDLLNVADFKTLTKDFSLRQDEDVFSIDNYILCGETKAARQLNEGIFSLDDPLYSSKPEEISTMNPEMRRTGSDLKIGPNFVGPSFVWGISQSLERRKDSVLNPLRLKEELLKIMHINNEDGENEEIQDSKDSGKSGQRINESTKNSDEKSSDEVPKNTPQASVIITNKEIPEVTEGNGPTLELSETQERNISARASLNSQQSSEENNEPKITSKVEEASIPTLNPTFHPEQEVSDQGNDNNSEQSAGASTENPDIPGNPEAQKTDDNKESSSASEQNPETSLKTHETDSAERALDQETASSSDVDTVKGIFRGSISRKSNESGNVTHPHSMNSGPSVIPRKQREKIYMPHLKYAPSSRISMDSSYEILPCLDESR